MSNTVKWIFRILAGLAVLFLVVALGALVFRYLTGSTWQIGSLTLRSWEGGREIPKSILPWDHIPLRPYRWHSGVIFDGIFPFGNFFGLLLCLGFLILIGMGVAAVLAFTRLRKPVPATVTGAPARLCPNCQHPVNEEWNHCPNCGTLLIQAE
jgi:hypothetical protein